MRQQLPPGAPATSKEAFAYIGAVRSPTINDMKVMVLVEASAKGMYDDLANAASVPAVAELLCANGREELGHAYRVSKAIKVLTGEAYPVPDLADNPYYEPMQNVSLSREMLEGLATLEAAGEPLYEAWAASVGDEDAAAIFRLNGAEETGHGRRMQEAAALMV
jgi:rubrerythrin